MMNAAVKPDDRGPVLLALARAVIASALGERAEADASAPWLREPGASFVTLTQRGDLRGCIGSLEARRPLLEDVSANARAAAFRDPRFRPLVVEELRHTRVEVSLLSPLEPFPARSEDEALARMTERVDGLMLEWRGKRATFLPQVWDQLPNPRDFFAHLKLKAGLAPDFWAEDLRLYRYHVAKWSEPETGPTVS
ncbi:AmmeMemoRadiSam system protein A [Rhodoblastus sp.]|uniref:AmmeMemoRadiSam system protein A n=1 Tax=Rhodoblastus sp. TaxID=1962975 RepID=UPI00262B464E|nr:AmmeMemoRadiSam system protein A [Rhodoblastus sp.]